MAAASSACSTSIRLRSIPSPSTNTPKPLSFGYSLLGLSDVPSKISVRAFANPSTKARFIARRRESVSVKELNRPLKEVHTLLVHCGGSRISGEYMSLPASQYSVLDGERIERVDENTFRCYVYRFKFFTFEVCPVLLVRVEEQPNGCCIRLLSFKLEGSPVVALQNDKFDAYMVNQISCESSKMSPPSTQQLTSDTFIEVSIDIPFAFRAIPVQAIESSGAQVLDQILKIMLPSFMSQLIKEYQAWATGDTLRQPLGTGEI